MRERTIASKGHGPMRQSTTTRARKALVKYHRYQGSGAVNLSCRGLMQTTRNISVCPQNAALAIVNYTRSLAQQNGEKRADEQQGRGWKGGTDKR